MTTGLLHETDPATGYSVARHILSEIAATGSEGIGAVDLAVLVADAEDGYQMGAWLRELRVLGLVHAMAVSPQSTRVRWHLTEAGQRTLVH